MAKDYAPSIPWTINKKAIVKHESDSKVAMNKNEVFFKKRYSLKPCRVILTRTNAVEIYTSGVKETSHVSKQISLSFAGNDKLSQKRFKSSTKFFYQSQRTSKVLKKSTDSRDSGADNSSESSNDSLKILNDHTMVKPCYVKLERLMQKNIMGFKNNKRYESKCVNNKNICSISEFLTDEEHFSPLSDTVFDNRSNISQESSVRKKSNPFMGRLSRQIDDESVSDKQVFSSDDLENNHDKSESSMDGSFISASLLSTPSSMARSERDETMQINDFSPDRTKSDANKKTELASNNVEMFTPLKRRRTLTLSSSSSEKEIRVSNYSVVTTEILTSSDTCRSFDFGRDKKLKKLDHDCLNHSVKRGAELSSSNSGSDCSVRRIYENWKNSYSGKLHKVRKKEPFKRNFSRSAFDVDISSECSVVSSSTIKSKSSKQSLKKKYMGLRTAAKKTAGKIKSDLCVQRQNSLNRTNTKNEKKLAGKCKPPCNSETEECSSDSCSSNLSNSAVISSLNDKESKHSSRRKKLPGVLGIFSSCKDRGEIKLVPPNEGITSNPPENKLNDVKVQKKCNVSFNYDIKPCYVILTREENIGKRLVEKSTYVHQDNEQIKSAIEVNIDNIGKRLVEKSTYVHQDNEQIKSAIEVNIDKKNKSVKSSLRRGHIDEKNDIISVKERLVLTESVSEKDCTRKYSDNSTNKNSIVFLQDPSDESEESNNIPVINYKKFLEDLEKDIVNEMIDKTHGLKEIEDVSHSNYSALNSINCSLAEKVNAHDPDTAYFADTDEYSDSDFIAESCNTNHISEDIDRMSAVLKVNLSESYKEGRGFRQKIPHIYGVGKDLSNVYIFKSKLSGADYLVDYFEYGELKKIFVTVQMKRNTSSNCNTMDEKNKSPTVSERLRTLGCFDKEDKRIEIKSPFISAYIKKRQHKKEDNDVDIIYKEKTGANNLNKEDIVLGSNKKISKPFIHVLRSSSGLKTSPEVTVSSASEDSSNVSESNYHCVHCFTHFSSLEQNYNHTCDGKLQEGFLCMYCEKIFPTYLELQTHKQLHFS